MAVRARLASEPAVTALGLFAIVAAAYAAGSELSWQSFSSGAAFGFPPAGVTVAALLLTSRRRWWAVVAAIVVGEIGIDLQHHLALQVAAAAAVANAVEAVAGASCVRWLCRGTPDLTARPGLLKFVAGAVVLGPLAGGLIGATIIMTSSGGWWPGLLLQWWAGDGIAVLVVGAPILLWARRRQMIAGRWREIVALVAVTAGLAVVAFRLSGPSAVLFLPLLAWAAFWIGDLGVVLAGTAFAVVANYMTAAGYGEFTHLGLASPAALAVTQVYIAVFVLICWLLAQEVTARIRAVEDREIARVQTEAERRERERVETLAALTRLLAAALTPEAIADVVAERVRTAIGGADAISLGVVSADRTRLEWIGVVGYPDEIRAQITDMPLTERAAATEAVRTGEPVIITGPAEYQRRYPGARAQAVLSAQEASWLVWPLNVGKSAIGSIVTMWTRPQRFGTGQLAFIAAVADLVAQALVRARVYADEHAIATVLQRAVMPKVTAPIPGLDIGTCYRQAGTAWVVGGDWYDALELPGGRAYIAVGDVAGHGISAAEDMTQIRNAGRALAIAGYQPARLLGELRRLTASVTRGQFATMTVVLAEPGAGRLSYASAGHPPVLVRRAGGGVETLPAASGPPLGPFDEATYIQRRTRFRPGDIALLYTDGLIERRGGDIGDGIERVSEHLRAWQAGQPLSALCRQLVTALAAQPQLDDICVLAVGRQAGEVTI